MEWVPRAPALLLQNACACLSPLLGRGIVNPYRAQTAFDPRGAFVMSAFTPSPFFATPPPYVGVGDDALRQLETGTARNIHDMPKLWQPVKNVPLARATDWFRLEGWSLGKSNIPPLSRDFLALTSGRWTLPGRLALNSLITTTASKNAILDSWVEQAPEVLALANDKHRAAPQAAWVAAYLLFDKRTLKAQKTLANVLRAAVAGLPKEEQAAAALDVLGSALRLGSMATWGGLQWGWKMNGRWFQVLMDVQDLVAGLSPATPAPAATKALAALRDWYPDAATARTALRPVWSIALAKSWAMCLASGGDLPGNQSDFDPELFEPYEVSPPAVEAPSLALFPEEASAWNDVAWAFVAVERTRGESAIGEHGPRLLNLALQTLLHSGSRLEPETLEALFKLPESAWDPKRCPLPLKSTIAQDFLALRLGPAEKLGRARPRF